MTTALALRGPYTRELPADPPWRINLAFSATGHTAACVRVNRADGTRGGGIETWNAALGTWRALTAAGDGPYSQLVPLDSGEVLVLRNGPGVHALVVLPAAGSSAPARMLGAVTCRGLRALPTGGPDLAVLVGQDDDRHARLWRVTPAGPREVPLSPPPDTALHGGVGIDAHRLGFHVLRDGRSQVIVVDVRTGTVTPMAGTGYALAATGSGDLLVATGGDPAATDLAWVDPAGGIRRPAGPSGVPERAASVLATDGHRIAWRVEDGARSRLYVYDDRTGRTRRIELGDAVLHPQARWLGGRLVVAVSAPARPWEPLAIDVERPDGARTTEGVWSDARLERLPTPAGPVEAVVYGGPDWRRGRRLVVALHGGPHSRWRSEFTPLFQHLTAHGIAVVALNPRGSDGYGTEFRDAIRGAWGGPDLDDVAHVGQTLHRYRRRHGLPAPMLLGTSYGGFLALLAAARDPRVWSRCAALAPFSSVESLYREASAGVRAFLDRHAADRGGDAPDLARLADRIRARVLLLHGLADEVIPATQSRRLAAALTAAGHDPIHREVPGGHDPLAQGDEAALRLVVRFLAEPDDHTDTAEGGDTP